MRRVSKFCVIIFLLVNVCGCSKKMDYNTEETITLTFWHIWAQTSNDTNGSIVEGIIKEWNENNPKIQIKSEIVENERYKTKIKTAVATNEMPDIFFSWGNGFSEPFIKSGKVLSLNNYLDKSTKNNMKDKMFDNVKYDEKSYGLPISFSVGTFYYNKKLFEDNKINIPRNYYELLQVVKEFSDLGIIPLGASGMDNWTGTLYYDILALGEDGVKGVEEALEGKNYELLLNTAYKVNELVNSGAFKQEDLDFTRDQLEMKFKNGEIAMYYTGNWFIGDLESSKIKEDIVISNFPGTDNDNNKLFLGGATDYLMVSSECNYKEEAVKAIEFISQRISKEFFEFGPGLPAWEIDDKYEVANKLAKELEELIDNSECFLYWDIYLGEEKGNIHKRLVYDLINGKISPEEFADSMSNIK